MPFSVVAACRRAAAVVLTGVLLMSGGPAGAVTPPSGPGFAAGTIAGFGPSVAIGDGIDVPATRRSAVAARTKSSVSAASSNARFGTGAKVRIRVRGTGSNPTGTVRVSYGTKSLGSRTLAKGYAVVPLPKSLRPGTRKLTVTYSGSAKHVGSRGSVTSTIVKTVPTVKATAAKVSTKQRSKISVTVKGPIATATGTVAVTRSGKSYGTARLASGRASVTLPVLAAGTFTFGITYRGNTNLSAKSTSVKVVVTKPVPRAYANCTDVWNRLGRPIYRSDAGFQAKFDRDNDGVGCESRPR